MNRRRFLMSLAPSSRYDEAFQWARRSAANGGLLVWREGALVYERYFGRGSPEARPNWASCGKSVTSLAAGILLAGRRDAFPEGLRQRVWTPEYLPSEAFPPDDPRRASIRFGHLLAMTAGIRGNSPGFVRGRPVELAPPGPDGWPAMVDSTALRAPLWLAPEEGYSYATASPHLVSMIVRRVTGMELEQYIREKLAAPLGWRAWGYAYRHARLAHTPGGGGIAVRPGDFLKLLIALLNEGRWEGVQLLPAAYVRACGRRTRFNPHTPYSFQFDVNQDGTIPGVPRDAFWKSGSGGHAIYVVPSLRLVAVKMGGRDGQYAEADTGFAPAPPASIDSALLPLVSAEEGLRETLRAIVRA
jgi:CubicO group peptidase (beta-lactamase class C family)